ncbi:MAG: sigma 54-interacting transcriptional regulator [Planctomycetes bacterium]|nr:sigma 54-interacting transcriptional regulator [Planctomycetota bacterium]MCB9905008.1 sigma 54-interacting transcriptional regulator [Planctomycetota bacterium]
MQPDKRLELGGGWKALDRLSGDGVEEVWRVSRADRLAVLRCLDPAAGDRLRGELDALSSGAGDGTVGFVDFGRLPDGRLALWREWVPGEDLEHWARGREPRELAVVCIELAVALAGLHARGGVHGDLKPANVIVRPDGTPILTDFGLGGGGRACGSGGGTLLGIAPERLDGSAPDARADLFALGSLMHGLFAGRFPNPRELYARFPGEDYPTAAGIPLGQLPEWSRSIVGSLLSRRPDQRPESAHGVARDLAARIGSEAPPAPRPALRFGPLELRDDWVRTVRRTLSDGRKRTWRLPPGEDGPQLAQALRIELATTDEAMLDLTLDGSRLALGSGSVEFFPHDADAPDLDPAEQPRQLPGHAAEALADHLRSALESTPEVLAELAARLTSHGGGADSIDRELLRLQRRGALVRGARGWRYEPGADATRVVGDSLEAIGEQRLAKVLESARAGEPPWNDVRAEFVRLCSEDRMQRALSWLADVRDACDEDPPADLLAEEAAAWSLMGRVDDAERVLRELAESSSASDRALELRTRGRMAARRYDHEAAREFFARALELDPNDGGDALYRFARLAYERGNREELSELLSRAATMPLDSRSAWNLEALAAMACLRSGDVDEARRRLDAQIEIAQRSGRQEALGVALSNRGTVERRSGRLAIAVRDLEEAVEIYASIGSAVGCARVEQVLGGAMRELGELQRAEEVLRRTLLAAEQTADGKGALAVRGSLGLLLSDRGHLRGALDELTASADALEQAGRAVDAAWMGAALAEVRARVGAGKAPSSKDPLPDPRVFLAAARDARWWKRIDLARDWAERARALAAKLSNDGSAEEARWILARLDGIDVTKQEWRVKRLAQDARVLAWLHAPPATLDAQAALDDVLELEQAGRDDRAARLAGAVALRTRDEALSREAAKVAKRCFDRAASGLTEGEREVFARRLLDGPDDHPEESEVLLHELPEELLDMDALALLEINHRLVEQQKLDELCREIVRSAVRMSGAERGFLVLEEDGEWSFDTALNSRCGAIDEPEVEVSTSILRRALDVGRPVRSSNALDDPNFEGARSVVELNLRSILCMPFQADADLRGVLYLDHRVAEEVFDERAERLLGLLADQAALAIRQVRRLEEIQRLNGMLRERVATRESELETARRALRDAEVVVPASGLVGNSGPMREVHRLLQFAARAELPTLITGESGTGKELAARAVHSMGPRKDGPFVAENCAALPESLIESELFGAEKGAFTGADKSRPGLFERADGGTLFLDEIGELPIGLQAKLLRVLETGEVRRIGSDRMRPVNFRLVAATNRDLQAESDAGRFRADLMYRLDAMRIEMPALARRVEDIPALVEHFLRVESSRTGVERRIAPEVIAALARRAWPGNVRELANEISRLCALATGDITDATLVRDVREVRPTAGSASILQGTLEEIERHAIESAIEACGGDKNAAAKRLGISRAKVYQRWKAWRE